MMPGHSSTRRAGNTMKHYLIHIPSWIHVAMSQHGYDKKDAIKRFKKQHGFIRMPNGFGIWEAK